MNKYLSVLFLSLVVAACSSEQCRHTTLLRAEAGVDEQPDSVILMLHPYAIDSFTIEADRALYGLVFTEAIHHIGLTIATDTLISMSRQFYEQQGDTKRLARCLLHNGIILYDMHRYAEGFQLLKRAESMAEGLHDEAFSYELFSEMGDINDRADNHAVTLDYYRRALQAATHSGVKEWKARCLNKMAATFDKMGETDSAKLYIDRCQPLYNSVGSATRANMLTNLGSYYLHTKHLDKAKKCLLQARQMAYSDKAVKLLGDIYATEGDMQQACDLWFQTLYAWDMSVCTEAYQQLIHYYDSLSTTDSSQHRMASHLSQRLNKIYQDTYEHSDAAGIIDMQAQYNKQQKEQRQYRITIILLSAILLLILLGGAVIWYHRRRIDLLNARFIESQDQYLLTRDKLTQMRKQKERQDRENSEQLKTVVARLHRDANRGQQASDDDCNSLAQLSYAILPALQPLLATLNTKEQTVCLLIRQHFQPTEIAILTASSPQAITNLRVRLLQKLFGETGGSRDFDQRLCSFHAN